MESPVPPPTPPKNAPTPRGRPWLIIGLSLGVGLFAGFSVGRRHPSPPPPPALKPTPAEGHAIRAGGYQLINPLLECEVAQGTITQELHAFSYKVNSLAAQLRSLGKASHISVYFRDLNNGPWFGINENEPFSPASLLKVPLLMAYLKQAERHPELLTQRWTFQPANRNAALTHPNITFPQMLELGQSYTAEELLRRMISYSDNDAMNLLYHHMDPAVFRKSYEDLGIVIPRVKAVDDFMSVKTYASFFRILFNASYLDREMSEKALRFLTECEFRQGLIAGLPPGTLVAHKFGERAFINSATKQLHDCGIVYYPNHPYLLCVMSRGDNLEALENSIAAISRQVYQEVDSALISSQPPPLPSSSSP